MKTYAPLPDEDPAFEEIMARVTDGIEAAGNPEGLSAEAMREATAKAFAEHAGRTFGRGPVEGEQAAAPEPDEPEVERVIVIPKPDSAPYWYEDPEEGKLIRHIINLRLALGKAVTGGIYITGPSGEGKTLGVIRMVEAMGLPFLKMDCPTITDPQKWFGARHIDKDGDRYEESPFVKAVQSGAVILLDELPRLHAHLWNTVMNFLAGNETVTLPDLGIEITRHPRTVFIATANEGAAFSGNHRVDWALAERFPFRFERSAPPTAERIKVVASHSGCDPDAASVLVDIAEKTQALYATGDLRAPISTRTLIHAGVLVASGYSEAVALGATAVLLYDGSADGSADGMAGDKSERSQVLSIIQGRTGKRR